MKEKLVRIIAVAAKKTANSAVNSASFFGMHQPKEPDVLRKSSKKL